ncbi:MAG: response regulator transcription factor [Deltaproteobacteria bacterium]|nr:response regulator transcription factor [Deltaproteobacteria bacterium]
MSPIRVLIVEDNEDTRAIIEITLKAFGWEAIAVEDGRQALEVLSKDTFSAAIVDWMLPGMSGLEITKWIRKNIKEDYLPVLILSARGELKDRVKGLEMGADDYLVKPFQHPELRARLNALLRVSELMKELKSVNVLLKTAEEENIKKARQLLAMQVVGSVAHNINQSLTALSFQCHLLAKSLPSNNTEGASAVTAIKEECDKMTHFVQSLLNIDVESVEPYIAGVTTIKID